MKSWDVWDTLLGRWYETPESIFVEMEKITKIDSFVWKRKHAEFTSGDKTFDGIYKNYKELFGASDSEIEHLKDLEYTLEYQMSFPIVENTSKITSSDLIVSDFYFTPDRLSNLLNFHKIPHGTIYTSYDGKSSGRVWNELRNSGIEVHTGDNLNSDFNIPATKGINVRHFLYKKSEIELMLEREGFFKLSNLIRASKLSTMYGDIEYEQLEINLPLMVLLAYYLNSTQKDLLFTTRDCYNLVRFYNVIFGTKAKVFHTSRDAYIKASPEFIKYATSLYNENSLIVDLQGTGKTCHTFFSKIGISPNYFTVVYSDLENTHKVSRIVDRADGFSDKIEKLNYSNLGKTYDLNLRAPELNNEFIKRQHLALETPLKFLYGGFNLGDFNNINPIPAIKYILRVLERHCVIEKYVNHEEI